MNIIGKRIIAVLVALIFAGITAGCDREVGEEGVTMGEPGNEEAESEGVVGEQQEPAPRAAGDRQQAGEQQFGEQQAGEEQAGEEQQVGGQGEQTVQKVREDVAEELGIPVDAVVIDSQVRQYVMDAKSDVERRGWVMVSSVENHLTRLNMDNLDQQERPAATELQQQVAEAERTLQQAQRASEAESAQIESNLQEQLGQIRDNWDEISDKLPIGPQPAGGGPMDDQRQNDEPSQPSD